MLEYADRIKVFQHGREVAEYRLPTEQVKQERFSPAGMPLPRHQPKHRHRPADAEVKQLRAMGQEVADYLDFVLQAPGVQRHQFARGLLELSTKVNAEVFRRVAARARHYRITDLATVQRIAWWILHEMDQPQPDVEVDESYRQREAFREGSFTDPPSLAKYDELGEPTEELCSEDSGEYPDDQEEKEDGHA